MKQAIRVAAVAAGLLAGAAAAGPVAAQGGPRDTLDVVLRRGTLACGVATAGVGLSIPDSQGIWRGMDADYCRAVAAAVLGSADKLRFVATTTQQRFTALQSGEVDMLARATTWTYTRDVTVGLTFAAINLYDGQGFMVKSSLGVKSAKELDGATICMLPGTTTEQNVNDYFRANKIKFQPVIIEAAAEIQSAFLSGRCDVYSNDRTDMVGIRASQGPRAGELVILPETISKEPLGPLVRKNDGRWFDLVRWTHFALVAAEELGVTQANVEQMRGSTNPEVRRLLGVEGDFGKQLGVDNGWVVAVVKAVGNYGEVWDRNQKPLGVERGLNRLWRDGGLQYAPPFR